MAQTIDRLVTELAGDPSHFEKAAAQAQRSNKRFTDNVANDNRRAAQNIQQSYKRAFSEVQTLQSSLLRLAPALGAAFSVQGAVAAADSYTRFTNSLKVAGLAGGNLIQVQDALYASAQKNGIALEPLGQLYGRAAQSASALGASQADLLQFTNGVTAALRIQGGDAASASGALLQLSQALAAGTVRAEEFNSINEGALPVLQAVAAGSDRFGGSVAKLRAAVLAGKVTSKEFFEAFLAGSAELEAKAAQAPLTISAAYQTLTNALTRYIGQADGANGASTAITEGLKLLAENIEEVANALLLLGTFMATRFVANAAAGAAAAGGFAQALRGVAGAAGGWGLVISAIVTALSFFALEGMEAAKATEALTKRVDEAHKAMLDEQEAAKIATGQTGQFKEVQDKAAVAAAALTGEVNKLGDAHMLAAAKAKAHTLEEMRLAAITAQGDWQEANRLYEKKVNKGVAFLGTAFSGSNGMPGMNPYDIRKGVEADLRYSDERQNLTKSGAVFTNRWNAFKAFERTPLADITIPSTGGGSAAAGKGGGSSGSKKKDREDELAALLRQIELEDQLAILKELGEAADVRQVEALEDQLEYLRKIAQYRQAGLSASEAEFRATQYMSAKYVARMEAKRNKLDVREIDANPSGFESSQDRIKDVMAPINAAHDEMRETFRSAFAGGIDAAARGGFPGLAQYFGDLLKQRLMDAFVNGMVDAIFPRNQPFGGGGGGGIFGFLGGLFGGAHAIGTSYAPGGISLVGENGPEVVNLARGSTVTPLTKIPSGRGGGGAMVVNNNVTVNANDALLGGWVRHQVAGAVASGMEKSVAASEQKVASGMAKKTGRQLR